jgi:hypothetical protein
MFLLANVWTFTAHVCWQTEKIYLQNGIWFVDPKIKEGGLGIEVLELKNKRLLSKWLFKLLTEAGMWQQLLSNKYFKIQTLAQIEAEPTDSPF